MLHFRLPEGLACFRRPRLSALDIPSDMLFTLPIRLLISAMSLNTVPVIGSQIDVKIPFTKPSNRSCSFELQPVWIETTLDQS